MLDAVVAMKGGCTHVASPRGDALFFDRGPIALGTSGSGHVLAGIMAGLAAREPALSSRRRGPSISTARPGATGSNATASWACLRVKFRTISLG
jgi:NAD(P)H-hydrate repair Nnr-like enzyme with NAD(P)H-hydrate dehydratase domain